MNRLRDSRKGFTDAIDTGTPSSRFFLHVMHNLTEMKRQMTDSKIESSKNLGVTVPTLYRWIPPYGALLAYRVFPFFETETGFQKFRGFRLTTPNCKTVLVIEIPRCFSSSIQSEVARRWSPRALTAPAKLIASPYRRSFSVSIVFPVSGWEIIAKLWRRDTCSVRAVMILLGSKPIQPK